MIDDPAVAAGLVKALERLYRDLAQGLHTARCGELDRPRQQQGVSRAEGRDDGEPDAVDPECAAARRGPTTTTRMPRRSSGRAASNGEPLVIDGFVVPRGGLQGRRQRALRRASSCAFWSRTAGSPIGSTFAGDRLLPPMRKLVEQPFWLDPSDPHRHALGHADPHTAARLRLIGGSGQNGARARSMTRASGERPCTASSPRASAPSRRSTRRSPGSSRSWRSRQPSQAA